MGSRCCIRSRNNFAPPQAFLCFLAGGMNLDAALGFPSNAMARVVNSQAFFPAAINVHRLTTPMRGATPHSHVAETATSRAVQLFTGCPLRGNGIGGHCKVATW